MTERAFTIASGVLLLAALVLLLWRNNLSVAFVLATLGAVAWFLSYRAQLRAKMAVHDPLKDDDNEED